MRRRAPRDIAASVRQQLLNEARASGRPFIEVLQYFAMERFLFRLSTSPHGDRFVLKGALLLLTWEISITRSTRDIDLLGKVANEPEVMAAIVREVCRQGVKLPQTEDLFYWTKEEFGLKPVVSLYQLTLHREGDHILVANKLLAASHYFNASLEILAGVPAADGHGLYLLSLRRSRIDPPTGKLAGILMRRIKSGLEAGVRESLELMRARLAEAGEGGSGQGPARTP